MKHTILLLLCILPVSLFVGCTTTNTSATYDQLQKSYTVERGRVIHLEEISIDNSENPHEGAVAGAIMGGVAGGHERDATGAVLGAVIGGIAGAAIDEWNKIPGLKIHIRKDNGSEVVILQRKESLENLVVNDFVEILTDLEGNAIVKRQLRS